MGLSALARDSSEITRIDIGSGIESTEERVLGSDHGTIRTLSSSQAELNTTGLASVELESSCIGAKESGKVSQVEERSLEQLQQSKWTPQLEERLLREHHLAV